MGRAELYPYNGWDGLVHDGKGTKGKYLNVERSECVGDVGGT